MISYNNISKTCFPSPTQIALIGCVIGGLKSIKDIHADAFEGLTASSMQCLPIKTLQVNNFNNSPRKTYNT